MDVSTRSPERSVKEDRQSVIERLIKKVEYHYETFKGTELEGYKFQAVSNEFNRKLATFGKGQDLYATCTQLQADFTIQIVMNGNTGARKVYPGYVDLEGKLKPYEMIMRP